MSKVKFDCVVTQRYTDRNGEEKKSYVNIGRVIEGDKGMSVKLDTIPLGWDGWFSLYEPKPRDSQGGNNRSQSGKPAPQSAGAADLEDIPFARFGHRHIP